MKGKVYCDGVVVKLKNKRVTVKRFESGIGVCFATMDEVDKPSAAHLITHKGKVKNTSLILSDEGIDALISALIKFRETGK